MGRDGFQPASLLAWRVRWERRILGGCLFTSKAVERGVSAPRTSSLGRPPSWHSRGIWMWGRTPCSAVWKSWGFEDVEQRLRTARGRNFFFFFNAGKQRVLLRAFGWTVWNAFSLKLKSQRDHPAIIRSVRLAGTLQSAKCSACGTGSILAGTARVRLVPLDPTPAELMCETTSSSFPRVLTFFPDLGFLRMPAHRFPFHALQLK